MDRAVPRGRRHTVLKTMRAIHHVLAAALLAAVLTSCRTLEDPSSARDDAARTAMNAAIRAEQPGNHYFGRRMYKKDYKMWGWVREPGRPWTSAKLVMLNEQKVLAPDRAAGTLGIDNNHEYRLEGRFTGDTVYEPASNKFYPEFELLGHELLTTSPAPIYIVKRQEDPGVRIIQQPVH